MIFGEYSSSIPLAKAVMQVFTTEYFNLLVFNIELIDNRPIQIMGVESDHELHEWQMNQILNYMIIGIELFFIKVYMEYNNTLVIHVMKCWLVDTVAFHPATMNLENTCFDVGSIKKVPIKTGLFSKAIFGMPIIHIQFGKMKFVWKFDVWGFFWHGFGSIIIIQDTTNEIVLKGENKKRRSKNDSFIFTGDASYIYEFKKEVVDLNDVIAMVDAEFIMHLSEDFTIVNNIFDKKHDMIQYLQDNHCPACTKHRAPYRLKCCSPHGNTSRLNMNFRGKRKHACISN
ncbi:hypothetical protein ACJX0J_007433, partial [Zea mays]